MVTTKLSSKGQVVLPRAVRQKRHWGEGMELVVEETRDGVLLRPLRPFGEARLEDVVGCTGYRGPARTIAQMNAAVIREARRRGR